MSVVRVARLASTCLLKLRQLTEVLAQLVASTVGIYEKPEEGQYEFLGRLRDHGILPREIYQLFNEVRCAGNAANHACPETTVAP